MKFTFLGCYSSDTVLIPSSNSGPHTTMLCDLGVIIDQRPFPKKSLDAAIILQRLRRVAVTDASNKLKTRL